MSIYLLSFVEIFILTTSRKCNESFSMNRDHVTICLVVLLTTRKKFIINFDPTHNLTSILFNYQKEISETKKNDRLKFELFNQWQIEFCKIFSFLIVNRSLISTKFIFKLIQSIPPHNFIHRVVNLHQILSKCFLRLF